jgi:hypothetical protein
LANPSGKTKMSKNNPRLSLSLQHKDGQRSLSLTANNLPELIEKLKNWNDWDSNIELLRQTKRFKADPKGVEAKERKSGWYWFKS